jgi:uncharacterized protein
MIRSRLAPPGLPGDSARAPARAGTCGFGWFIVALALLFAPLAAQAQTFPKLTGRVVDAANVIPPEAEARLNAKLEALQNQSQRQFVIATIPSLEDYEISDYGYRLGREWGIGDKQRNDGALLIIAPNERKLRIEVGYGLEGIMTDGMSSLIINQTIVPRFKAGDMAGGIEAGADAVIQQLILPEDQARKIAAEASQPPEAGIPWSAIIVLIFIFFFVLPMFRRAVGGKRYGSSGPVIVWGGGSGSSWGSSSGGGFGGGGFSGGGGSFGGGGSSGSW